MPRRRAGRCRRPAQRSRGRPSGARAGAGPAPHQRRPRDWAGQGGAREAPAMPARAVPVRAPRPRRPPPGRHHHPDSQFLDQHHLPLAGPHCAGATGAACPCCTARFRGRPRPRHPARPIPPRRASPRPLLTRAHPGTLRRAPASAAANPKARSSRERPTSPPGSQSGRAASRGRAGAGVPAAQAGVRGRRRGPRSEERGGGTRRAARPGAPAAGKARSGAVPAARRRCPGWSGSRRYRAPRKALKPPAAPGNNGAGN